MNLTKSEFDFFRNFLFEAAGIEIDSNKHDLIKNRLHSEVNTRNVSYEEYIRILKTRNSNEVSRFVNLLTTNKTDFFREAQHFERLKEACENQHKNNTVYVWSAACSTGEEVYTIGMLLEEMPEEHRISYRILGTDIDTQVLKSAANGVYREEQVEKIRKEYLRKYFLVHPNGSHYKVTDSLRRNTKFRQLNLTERLHLPVMFDFIFMRNVLIYFPKESHEKAIEAAYQNLNSGGLLFIGHSESLQHRSDSFEFLGNSTYKKVA